MKDFLKKHKLKLIVLGLLTTVSLGVKWYLDSRASDGILIVDKTKVTQDWIVANKDIIVCDDYTETDCSILVDLNKLNPKEIEDVDKWLRSNKDSICYKESYPLIEKNHLVTDVQKIKRIEASKEPKTIKLSEFTTGITNFDKCKYGSYVNFIRNPSSKEVAFGYKPDYKRGDVSLSIPSIKSIIEVNNITDLDKYNVTFSFIDAENQIALIIESTDPSLNLKKHYNYSTDPTKPIITTMFMLY